MSNFAYYTVDWRVTAFSTTRHGGCSQGNYASMNVNAYCGDQPEAVARNREQLCRELGLSGVDRLIIPHQVHGDFVMKIDEGFLALPAASQQELLEGVDALITDQPDVCIGVSTADCTPILIYDPVHHCAAAVHAGWRGTAKRIVQAAADMMAVFYKSRYADLKAVIGPCISQKNFEVGQEVYDTFLDSGFPMEQVACLMPASPAHSQDGPAFRWHIDLVKCNALLLEEIGLLPEHICDADICTYDHVDEYFSARRLGINSGRIFTGIILH